MPRPSAGLLLYRRRSDASTGRQQGTLEVLLVHPGGPLWARRDDGAWSIPKGEVREGEAPLTAAEREVAEELGVAVPSGPRHPLGTIVQRAGKRVDAWALECDLDPADVQSNRFEMEWPPRSGQVQTFPEIDRAAWFPLPLARRKLLTAQAPLLDRLAAALGAGTVAPPSRDAAAGDHRGAGGEAGSAPPLQRGPRPRRGAPPSGQG